MSVTGIVRRIDELGRIVIPKELRRTMRLNEGDEMEITAHGDNIMLRKFSSFETIGAGATAIAKLLVESTGADVLFVNSSSVTMAEGKNKRKFSGAKLGSEFSEIIKSRKSSVLHGEDVRSILENVENSCCYAVTEPVVVGGDFAGALVLMLDTMPSDIARTYLHFSAELIAATLF
jgi:AbrB family transcriptional regulator (stage V sporulation protein T)